MIGLIFRIASIFKVTVQLRMQFRVDIQYFKIKMYICNVVNSQQNSQCSQTQTPHQPNIPLGLFSGTLNYKGEERCHSFSCHEKSRHSQIDQDNDDLVIVLARPAVRVLHDQAAEGGAVTGDLREG